MTRADFDYYYIILYPESSYQILTNKNHFDQFSLSYTLVIS